MSADNWTRCPTCYKRIKEIHFKCYGKVSEEAYKAVTIVLNAYDDYGDIKLNEKQKIALNEVEEKFNDGLGLVPEGNGIENMREDYELGVGDDEEAYVRYSGDCQNCSSTWSFEKDNIKKS